jgi:hypothetical protein
LSSAVATIRSGATPTGGVTRSSMFGRGLFFWSEAAWGPAEIASAAATQLAVNAAPRRAIMRRFVMEEW